MKYTKILLAAVFIAGTFTACEGDHYSNNGSDSVQNSYHVQHDSTMMDTATVKSADYSGSGGAKLIDTSRAKKDTSKM